MRNPPPACPANEGVGGGAGGVGVPGTHHDRFDACIDVPKFLHVSGDRRVRSQGSGVHVCHLLPLLGPLDCPVRLGGVRGGRRGITVVPRFGGPAHVPVDQLVAQGLVPLGNGLVDVIVTDPRTGQEVVQHIVCLPQARANLGRQVCTRPGVVGGDDREALVCQFRQDVDEDRGSVQGSDRLLCRP